MYIEPSNLRLPFALNIASAQQVSEAIIKAQKRSAYGDLSDEYSPVGALSSLSGSSQRGHDNQAGWWGHAKHQHPVMPMTGYTKSYGRDLAGQASAPPGLMRYSGTSPKHGLPSSYLHMPNIAPKLPLNVVDGTSGGYIDMNESFDASKLSTAANKLQQKHVCKACIHCKRAHLACDEARPCRRCMHLGKFDTCVDVEHKRRGRPKSGVTTKTNFLRSHVGGRQISEFEAEPNTGDDWEPGHQVNDSVLCNLAGTI